MDQSRCSGQRQVFPSIDATRTCEPQPTPLKVADFALQYADAYPRNPAMRISAAAAKQVAMQFRPADQSSGKLDAGLEPSVEFIHGPTAPSSSHPARRRPGTRRRRPQSALDCGDALRRGSAEIRNRDNTSQPNGNLVPKKSILRGRPCGGGTR
jgi:hypothetical protein